MANSRLFAISVACALMVATSPSARAGCVDEIKAQGVPPTVADYQLFEAVEVAKRPDDPESVPLWLKLLTEKVHEEFALNRRIQSIANLFRSVPRNDWAPSPRKIARMIVDAERLGSKEGLACVTYGQYVVSRRFESSKRFLNYLNARIMMQLPQDAETPEQAVSSTGISSQSGRGGESFGSTGGGFGPEPIDLPGTSSRGGH